MRNFNIQFLADRLQQAALDPAEWPTVLQDMSRSAGGAGAVLFSVGTHLPGPLSSPELEDMTDDYLKNGWCERDERYRLVPLILERGIAVDQDFVDEAHIRKSAYYQDFLGRHNRRWFAGMGFRIKGEGWVLSIQRTITQGPFLEEETRSLTKLLRPLAEAATLTQKLGFARVEGLADALELIGQPCIVFDDRARVLTINAKADALVGALIDVKSQTLALGDPVSQARFDFLLKAASDAVLQPRQPAVAAVRDRHGARHIVRAIALRGWARYAFTGARALVLFDAQKPGGEAAQAIFRAAFGVTPAEARLAMELCDGHSVSEAAVRLGITYETARSYLKLLLLKTDTHRQGELVMLLARTLG